MFVILISRVMIMAKYPFPENLDYSEVTDLVKYYQDLPDAGYVMIIISHLIGAFGASLFASLVARKGRFTMGIIAGFAIFCFILVRDFWIDYPKLYLMIDVLLVGVTAFAGAAFGQGREV